MTMKRIELMNLRKNRKSGTLTCKKCRTPGHFALWEDGLCRRCYVPKPIDLSEIQQNYSKSFEPPEQTAETLDLKDQISYLMSVHEIPNTSTFAQTIGVQLSGFYNWYSGKYAKRGQEKMNRRIKTAITKWQNQEAVA